MRTRSKHKIRIRTTTITATVTVATILVNPLLLLLSSVNIASPNGRDHSQSFAGLASLVTWASPGASRLRDSGCALGLGKGLGFRV